MKSEYFLLPILLHFINTSILFSHDHHFITLNIYQSNQQVTNQSKFNTNAKAENNYFLESHYSEYKVLQKYLAVQNNLPMDSSGLSIIRHFSQDNLIQYLSRQREIEASQAKEDFDTYVLRQHNLYCCSNFLELIRNFSGYENYIRTTLQKYYSDKKFSHLVDELDYIDGHENDSHYKGFVQKVVSIFKEKITDNRDKKAFRDFLKDEIQQSEEAKQEIERLERIKKNNNNLNASVNSKKDFEEAFYISTSDSDVELANRYQQRRKAFNNSIDQNGKQFDYSNQIKNYKFTDSNAEFFSYCYGGELDKQLHEELCEIRKSAIDLQTQCHDNENVEAFSGMILHFTALAKVQSSANVAFHLSDFSHYLLKAEEILVGGLKIGLTNSIKPFVHPIDAFLKPLCYAGISLGQALFEVVSVAVDDPFSLSNPTNMVQKATDFPCILVNCIKENPKEAVATIVELLIPIGLSKLTKFAKLKKISMLSKSFEELTLAEKYFQATSNAINTVINPIKMALQEAGEVLKVGLEYGKDALRNVINVVKGEPELVLVGDLVALQVPPEYFKDVKKLTEVVSKEIKVAEKIKISKGSNFLNQSKDQLLKSKVSHELLVKEHVEKLAAYISNPDKCDNLGILKNVSQDIRQKIIQGRTKELKRQIQRQRGDLDKINELLKLKE